VALLFAVGERSTPRTSDRAPGWHFHVPTMITMGIATALVVLVTQRAFGETAAAPAWLGLWALGLVVGAWRSRASALYVWGVGLLVVAYASLLVDVALAVAVAGSTHAAAIVIGVPLGVALVQDRLGGRWSATGTWRGSLGGVTSIAYGFALVSLTFVLYERIGPDWAPVVVSASLVALAVVPALRILARAQDAAIVAALALGGLHVLGLFQSEGVAPFWPSIVLVAAIVGIERATRALDPARSERWPGTRTALVAVSILVILSALVHAPEVGAGWITVGWSLVAASALVLGFAWRSGTYRRLGLAVFGVTLVRVFLVDVRSLPSASQMIAFLILGVSLVAVAWLYARFANDVRRWL
jgi:hypothetical protein